MFRKLAVVICLISFAPVAVSAQDLATMSVQTTPVTSVTENTSPGQAAILTLPTGHSAAMLMAAADTSQSSMKGSAPAQVKEVRSFEWGNFGEVHLGGYRWVWWVGAIAALAAIHAGAN